MITFNLKEIEELQMETIKALGVDLSLNEYEDNEDYHWNHFEQSFLKLPRRIKEMACSSNNNRDAQMVLVDLFFSKEISIQMKMALEKDIIENKKVNKNRYMFPNLINKMTDEIVKIRELAKTKNSKKILTDHLNSLLNYGEYAHSKQLLIDRVNSYEPLNND